MQEAETNAADHLRDVTKMVKLTKKKAPMRARIGAKVAS